MRTTLWGLSSLTRHIRSATHPHIHREHLSCWSPSPFVHRFSSLRSTALDSAMSSNRPSPRSEMETDDDPTHTTADHYDAVESDEEPSAAQQSKRRKIVDDDDDGGEEVAAAAAPTSPPKDRKPTASSRATADKGKKKGGLSAEDAKGTRSMLSFWGQPGAAAKGGKGGEKEKTQGTKAAAIASFFTPKSAKKETPAAPTSTALETTVAEPHAEETKQGKEPEVEVEAEKEETKAESDEAMNVSDADEAKDPSPPPPQSSFFTPASSKPRPSPPPPQRKEPVKADAPKPKPPAKADTRAKGGPLSAMKRKRLAKDAAEADESDPSGLQEVADKEAAAIEDEDAVVSSSEEDEDHSDLARELMDINKSAAEEKITSEDSLHPTSTPLGTPAYHPVKSAGWEAGKAVPYAALSAMFAAVEAESSRLKIIAIVSDFLRSVIALTPQDLLPSVYLCINAIAPAYEGKETGVGDFILKKVIANTTGLSLQRLRDQAKDVTDLGVLALNARKKQVTLGSQSALTVRGVFSVMRDMGSMSGKAVSAKKEGLITKLMVASKGEEAKFLIRSLQGTLRIGLQTKSLIAALARALVLTPPTLQADAAPVIDARKVQSEKAFQAALETGLAVLKQAYIECPNLDLIIGSILQYGLTELPTHCTLTPGVPVEVMLGKPASSITAILDKFSHTLFTLEYKYDGERAQVHRTKDGLVKVYSRNSEDNTRKYPDVVSRLPRYSKEGVADYIIDCECVAWDAVNKRLLPFQTLTTRKRKDVKEEEITVQVALFAFDLLYLNGQSYLDQTLRVRREALRSHFVEVEGEFAFAVGKDTGDVEEIGTFLNEAVQSSCEGLMVKALDEESMYTPGKRSWLKCKKDYLDGVGDTLDLVPIAAFYGKGKRTGHFGAFLLAVYDDEAEEYQSICKIGTGFSEEDIAQHAAFYQKTGEDGNNRLLPACPRYYKVGDTMKPDVWLAPAQVWEVKCADLSISPVHQAAVGVVDSAKGIALRFPRFMRVRDDKKPEEATTSEQVVDFFRQQNVRAGQRKNKGGDDDD